MTFKKSHQVGYPAMIDVFIRGREPPFFRIAVKILFHVFMHFPLKIDTRFTVCPDHDIRADSLAGRYVAIGIWNGEVGRIIGYVLACQLKGCL